MLVFVGSIAVLLICHFGLSSIDEDYANKNAGYWPEPLDYKDVGPFEFEFHQYESIVLNAVAN
jgi:hypothetical protein